MRDIINIINGGSYIENFTHYNLQVSQEGKEQVEQDGEEVLSPEELLEPIAKVEKSLFVSPPHCGQGTSSSTLQRVENLCPHFLQRNS
jgi:hypothetical protein